MSQIGTKKGPKIERRGGARLFTGPTKKNLYLSPGEKLIKDLRIVARVEEMTLEEVAIHGLKQWLKEEPQKSNLENYRNIIPTKPRKTKPKTNKYLK